jgi:hypothetical protein
MQAKPLLKERKYLQLVDPKIGNSHDFHQLLGVVQVTEQCLRKNPNKRLAMDKVTLKYIKVVFMKNCKVILKNFEVLATDMSIIA